MPTPLSPSSLYLLWSSFTSFSVKVSISIIITILSFIFFKILSSLIFLFLLIRIIRIWLTYPLCDHLHCLHTSPVSPLTVVGMYHYLFISHRLFLILTLAPPFNIASRFIYFGRDKQRIWGELPCDHYSWICYVAFLVFSFIISYSCSPSSGCCCCFFWGFFLNVLTIVPRRWMSLDPSCEHVDYCTKEVIDGGGSIEEVQEEEE